MMSTRTLESAVKGPYSRANKAVKANKVPRVKTPETTRLPPKPYTIAVAIVATVVSATKKIVLVIAIRTPISLTRAAFL